MSLACWGQAPLPLSCQQGLKMLNSQDPAGAAAPLEKCVREAPGRAEPYVLLCAAYQMQGNADALFRTASEAARKFPQEERFFDVVGP